jgi:hypothetical protein
MSILGNVFRSIPALFRNRSRPTLENLAPHIGKEMLALISLRDFA